MTNHPVYTGETFCDNVLLHQTSLIQPHGVLLVVDKRNLTVIQASTNASEIFPYGWEALINKSLVELLDEDSFRDIEGKRDAAHFTTNTPLLLQIKGPGQITPYLSLIHEQDEALLVEMEHNNAHHKRDAGFDHVIRQIQHIMSSISMAVTVEEVASIAAREIKKLSGYDKVMIYSFDEEWNGTVIAEEREPGMDAYLGLKFPASDVPKGARDLYLKNPYRVIPTRQYEAVPLMPQVNPLTNAPTNLTHCKLRSVVKVHLEYLKNMNVMASMSTRIIHKEKLWGLIACHHGTPKYLSFNECSVFDYLSNVLSSKIASLLYLKSSGREEELGGYFTQIIESIRVHDNLVTSLVKEEHALRSLLAADGVAICWEGEIFPIGSTPGQEETARLRNWLRLKGFTGLTHMPALSREYEEAKSFSDAGSGILVLPIQSYKGNFVIAFRGEVIKQVSWGGNPGEVINFEKDRTQYHPRNSFRIWKETVRHTATAWSKEELGIADKLRNVLVEHTLKALTKSLEKRVSERTADLRVTNKVLEATNDELFQMVYVTSHDLQEPARKVSVFGSTLKGMVKDDEGTKLLDRLLQSSTRISTLIRNLLSYSRLSLHYDKEPTDLNEIVQDVLSDMELLVEEKKAQVTISGLPVITAVPDQMRQVFHSLLSNALKFGREGVQVSISAEKTTALSLDSAANKNGAFCRIRIKDNGIGFKEAYADKMFKLFRKLHAGEEYEGVGIGLAIAKKIIDHHQGIISGTGKENEGAEFIIVLPLSENPGPTT
jgi:light-regulated signal transduction histidine kinase (bacteriophytochrome)